LEGGGRVGDLERLMREQLHDPTLTLGFRTRDNTYVCTDGTQFTTDASALTTLHIGGEPLAKVAHDPMLDDEIVQMVGSAAALTFQNEQLHAELRARVQEVEESRARIVTAADDARRQVERDVHDGAQQRIVSLGMALRVIEDRLRDGPDDVVRELLATARKEAAAAITDIRNLAHGLHPVLLTDGGLAPAVQRLADHSPLVVTVDIPEQRHPAGVEECAYYVIAEGLANAIKHADATEVEIRAVADGGHLVVTVVDNGTGGASLDAGSGIQGLRDRVDAVGGWLSIKDDNGTRLEARISCG
jgi:signal transduction histidine kinase